MDNVTRRLNWGCGHSGEPGWINSDVKAGPGIDISADIQAGLPLEDGAIDYVVSIHALQEIPYPEIVSILQELRRVLKPDGVLRLVLPDLDKHIHAYLQGDRTFFCPPDSESGPEFAGVPDEDVSSLGGKLIVQLIWYGYTRTLFTADFIEELLLKSGFREVHHCAYQETRSPYIGIVELDNRENESLYVEAVK
jgi:SAM-dependent methyltransferase